MLNKVKHFVVEAENRPPVVLDAQEVLEEVDQLFERGTLEWAAAFGALCEMHRMMELGRSYLGGRPGERGDLAKSIAEAVASVPRGKR